MIVKDIEQSHLWLGTRGVSLDDELYYAFAVLNSIMGGTMSSRLFQTIREQKGLAYSVYSMTSSFTDMGYFGIYAGVAHSKLEAALRAIASELAFLRKKMITKDELLMAKEQLKGNYIFGQESVNNRMYSSGKNLLLLNQVFTVEEVAEGIDLVTMEEIERVIEIISDISNYSAVAAVSEKFPFKNLMRSL